MEVGGRAGTAFHRYTILQLGKFGLELGFVLLIGLIPRYIHLVLDSYMHNLIGLPHSLLFLRSHDTNNQIELASSDGGENGNLYPLMPIASGGRNSLPVKLPP